jgi:hypothetical protein
MTPAQFDALYPGQFARGNLCRIMTVYRSGLAGPTCDIIPETGTYQTDLLPGFVLPLSRLLTIADQWTKKNSRTKPRSQPNAPDGGTDG